MSVRKLPIAIVVLLVAVLALGGYVLRVARKAQQPILAADTRPIAPPVTGQKTNVQLYVANDQEGVLHKETASITLPTDPQKRAREILRALVTSYQERTAAHPLGAGADINDVYLVNSSLAVVDANAAFAEGHRSGILVEQLTLASMAQTLAANIPGITRLKLLVDGKERPTLAGHADLIEPYDIPSASRLVK